MRMTRREKRNNLMKGSFHKNDTLPSKGMITLVSLFIQNIPNENAFKSLEVQLRNMDVANAPKNFGRKRRTKSIIEETRKKRLEVKNPSGHPIH